MDRLAVQNRGNLTLDRRTDPAPLQGFPPETTRASRMSEGHEPGDVRSFLPRPGEPVEQYAERLRALHRDLTLVLQAVERGLAAAGTAEPVASGPIEVAPVAEPAPEAIGPREHSHAHGPVRPPLPRVEVLPAPSGEKRRADDTEDRRATAEPPAVEEELRDVAPRPTGRGQRFARRPSAAAGPAPEPEWVEHEPPGESFTAATFAPVPEAPRAPAPPVLIAAVIAGWLTVVALVLALLLG